MEERIGILNFLAGSADDAKVVAASTPALKPERFGRYVLLDRIGAGGMAEVYRAVMPGAHKIELTIEAVDDEKVVRHEQSTFIVPR